MAKMFYSLEETAKKLFMTTEQVMELSEDGRISAFKDRDKFVFRKEQIDLFAESIPAIDKQFNAPVESRGFFKQLSLDLFLIVVVLLGIAAFLGITLFAVS